MYCIGGIFRGKKISHLEKIIHRKKLIFMVHTLFLTNSQNFNPVKYTIYTVYATVTIGGVHKTHSYIYNTL